MGIDENRGKDQEKDDIDLIRFEVDALRACL